MKIVSWNVNGIVACRRKGFLKFLASANPDIVCCQEVRAKCPLNVPGYYQFWNLAHRPGYAGTLCLSKELPLSCSNGFGIEALDGEGRAITLEYKRYFVVNVYVPSLHQFSPPDRPDYRRNWEQALRNYVAELSHIKPVILCGDFNVCHTSLDIYPSDKRRPYESEDAAIELRESFEKLLGLGYTDAFRMLYPWLPGKYTWWAPKNDNRVRNCGSRLDYFLIPDALLGCVQSVKHHTGIVASDHCPISMVLRPIAPAASRGANNDELAAMWRAVDWAQLEDEIYRFQAGISEAAYYRDWSKVDKLQRQFIRSMPAKLLAVRTVADANSAPGVDGVRLHSDAEKMRLVTTLTAYNYTPLPYRYEEVSDQKRRRVIHIPAARDKAMLCLYALALSPVAEATADHGSFSARRGRSALDLHVWLLTVLNGDNAPEIVVIIDVKSYYTSIIHKQLIARIPMDRKILSKFLRAGLVRDGELFETEQGISLGTSLSPILGNMLLDGLQTYIYDHLYQNGAKVHVDGRAFRFCDDIIVTAKTAERAKTILSIVNDFLAARGLTINHQKTHIGDVRKGFDFMGRHYQKLDGVVVAKPSKGSVIKAEHDLANLIQNWKGTQRNLIGRINRKLTGWASYHRVTDAYIEFRHIDTVVNSLLVERMCGRHPRWSRQAILTRYWYNDAGDHVYALPNDRTCRVTQLAPLSIVHHKPCKLGFNYYLDHEYYEWLKTRRDIIKASGKYKAVWRRQEGKCAYCGKPMLPDETVDVVERNLGNGWRPKNLIYIHRHCAFDGSAASEGGGLPLDIIGMLSDLAENAPLSESPYLELSEYFRHCDKMATSLTFREIETILCEPLDWTAYFYESFWYATDPEDTALWKAEGYPFHMIQLEQSPYCASDSWLKQGYKIKAIDLDKRRISFRRVESSTTGLKIPKELTRKRLPDQAVYELQKFFEYIIDKYGLRTAAPMFSNTHDVGTPPKITDSQ